MVWLQSLCRGHWTARLLDRCQVKLPAWTEQEGGGHSGKAGSREARCPRSVTEGWARVRQHGRSWQSEERG